MLSDTSQLIELETLRLALRDCGRVVVAFSGGADSAFLAKVATETLGPENCLVVTAVSPSLAPDEEVECGELATEWGMRWMAVYTDEMANPSYSINDGQRCYWCKTELMDELVPLAEKENAVVVLGVNVDDLGDHRPGQAAAAERGARFPLVEAGFDKNAVRAWSRNMGLRTWDKPAAACLASRLPYGTPVSVEILTSVARAEAGLKALGFRQLRVRHYGDTARIELESTEMDLAISRRAEISEVVRAAGYTYVTLDLDGFISGNLNRALEA